MHQDRNPLRSLFASLRKAKRTDDLEMDDPSALESRRRLEERIEQALTHVTETITDREEHQEDFGEQAEQIEAA
jgi:hypothetical protein